ncbi:MAG TPA: hypothetical protein VEY88_11665 [Archangium sp.]|nr:hypothetical protein [Archangium sp.]
MKSSSWSAWVLAMCLVGGAARAGSEGDRERETQVWLEPAWGSLGALGSLASLSSVRPFALLYVPVGVELPLGQRGALGLELSYMYRRFVSESSGVPLDHRTDVLRFSVGPVFRLSGERRHEGFFVQPLVTGTFSSRYEDVHMSPNSPGARVDRWTSTVRALEAGVDVGYGFRFGDLTLTTLIGASVGYSSRASPDSGLVWMWIIGPGAKPDVPRVVWNLNLDLVRVGWVF